MQKRILPIAFIAVVLFSLFNWNCTKLDVTDIGSDQLPAVDNVHTFADTLPVLTTQGVFVPDSTIVGRTDYHVFGINNDPVFGQTNASIYFQLKPTFYPFYLGNPGDTIFNAPGVGLDSIVLCLKYQGFYGDSTIPLHVDVKEVVDGGVPYYFRDSVTRLNNVNYHPNTGNLIASADIDVRRLADTVHYTHGTNYTVNTIRIRFPIGPGTYADKLYLRDTLAAHIFNNAFLTDSLFRQFYNGIAVVASSGNQLIYTNLNDADTKIEIHFRKSYNGIKDTLINTLVLNGDYVGTETNPPSATANWVTRNRLGLPSGDQVIYLQTSPGTYANLTIPALSTLSNRIIHRAELIVEEIPDVTGTSDKFKVPNFLYIELKDSGTANWKPIYHDLNTNELYDPDYKNPSSVPFFPSSVDYTYFGGFVRDQKDVFGNATHFYNFNITRYVQDIVTRHLTNSDIRLSAPFNFKYPQYSIFPINYGNYLANGRVKVGGGSNPNYRLRLRIIYSNL